MNIVLPEVLSIAVKPISAPSEITVHGLCCSRKVKHSTQHAAEWAAKDIFKRHGRAVNVYRCLSCGKFHTGGHSGG